MHIESTRFSRIVACAGLFLLSSAAITAQNTSNQQMDNGAKKMMRSPDTVFAMNAAQGGIAEVQMGKLAADKAIEPDVKAFGQQMIEDHTKANDDLKSVAAKEGMTLPADMNPKQQATYDRLRKLSGEAFDLAYVKDMRMDHQEDVKEFQKEVSHGKDDQIKGFASRTLPVIQGHLDKIKTIHAQIGVPGKLQTGK